MAATSIGFTPPIVAQVGRAWVRRGSRARSAGPVSGHDTSKVVVLVPPPPSATV